MTADHGEGLGENRVYYDHHGLYEWDVHIPLILYHPAALSGGKRVKSMVTHMEIAPTVLELAGVKELGGRSLLAVADGEEEGYRFVVCVENTRMTKRAIRTARWKLIQTLRPDPYSRPAGYLELYDLEKGEEENLAETERDVAEELLMVMEKWYRSALGEKGDPLMLQPISMPIPE